MSDTNARIRGLEIANAMLKQEQDAKAQKGAEAIGGCIGIMIMLFLGIFMFDFSVWYLFGLQLPWYLDILGALALTNKGTFNMFNIWLLTFVAYYAGVVHPWINLIGN